jgi:catechol 2,3-dioxygenase-like lactoylglutathione lyase family enzyme
VVPAIQVENLVEEISRLQQLGVDLVHDQPQDFPAGQFIACRDGSGNLLEILQFS